MNTYNSECHERKQGDMIILSHGSYSDYSVVCLLEAMHDINLAELWSAYFEEAPPGHYQEGRWEGSRDVSMSAFALWLMKHEHAREIELHEFHHDDPTWPHESPVSYKYDSQSGAED